MAGDLQALLFENFDGGWNPRDSAYDLELNESPDTYNCTIDEKGSVGARLGYSKSNSSGQPAAVITGGYYSDLLGAMLWQAGTNVYTQTTHTSVFSASVKTWTTSARTAMVDFNGYVYAIHPVDGVYRTSDGTTWTAVASSPTGDSIAVWQNKLWATNAANDVLSFSVPGGGATWTGTGSGTVNIRAKDGASCTAVHASETEGLIVYKEESAYRVYDSSTGAYQTLSTTWGAGNHYAVCNWNGRMYSICQHGVFATDGNSALGPIADKVAPLWDPGRINFSKTNLWCAGWKPPNLFFSLTLGAGQTTNNLMLEISPEDGWIMPHSCAAGCLVTYGENNVKLLGASPTVNGQVYIMYDDVGTDDGANISSRFQTAWVRPSIYGACRFRELLVRGSNGESGGLPMLARVDGEQNIHYAAILTDLHTGAQENTWGSGTWGGGGAWGPLSEYETASQVFSLGTGRDISFEFYNDSDATRQAPALLDIGSGITRGCWHISGLRLSYVELGRARP